MTTTTHVNGTAASKNEEIFMSTKELSESTHQPKWRLYEILNKAVRNKKISRHLSKNIFLYKLSDVQKIMNLKPSVSLTESPVTPESLPMPTTTPSTLDTMNADQIINFNATMRLAKNNLINDDETRRILLRILRG